jgi:hypothetical protein
MALGRHRGSVDLNLGKQVVVLGGTLDLRSGPRARPQLLPPRHAHLAHAAGSGVVVHRHDAAALISSRAPSMFLLFSCVPYACTTLPTMYHPCFFSSLPLGITVNGEQGPDLGPTSLDLGLGVFFFLKINFCIS